ncbi:MAG: hypothetical protein HC871_00150 [Rhizobiales bacterium]|nr:hypothetical protein [Hyphomicrobiales bacterium]
MPLCLLCGRRLQDESAENGIGRGTSANARRTGASTLAGELPAQTLGGLALLFSAAAFDFVDAPITFGANSARLARLCLIGQRKIEANGGETA